MEEYRQIDQEGPNTRMKKDSKVKSFFMMLLAAITGSALTLAAVPQLDRFHEEVPVAISNEQETSNEQGSSLRFEQISYKPTSLADMIEQVSEGIVGIVQLQQQQHPFSRQTTEAAESGTGSGVIFKKTNDASYIVTNYHVIEGATQLEVSLYNGERVEAQVVGSDPLTDLAVLKVSGDAGPVLEIGDSSALRVGDQVLAIGNPLGLQFSRTVTQGIVSGIERTISVMTAAGEWDLEVIQTDAAINPGNSGGALINTAGQVVGINSLKIVTSGVEGIGFAIPSNEVLPIIEEIIASGQVSRPYVGVGLADFSEVPYYYLQNLPSEVNHGAIVTNVAPASPAATAGIQVEDILLAIDGKKITTSSDLRKYLYKDHTIGEEITIELYRQGEVMKVEVILASN